MAASWPETPAAARCRLRNAATPINVLANDDLLWRCQKPALRWRPRLKCARYVTVSASRCRKALRARKSNVVRERVFNRNSLSRHRVRRDGDQCEISRSLLLGGAESAPSRRLELSREIHFDDNEISSSF